MRATIKNYLEAVQARGDEEDREAGFSLVGLIVVVVVIGVLIAVAFPIFGAVQHNVAVGALNSAAAEGATVAASEAALPGATTDKIDAALLKSNTADYTLSRDPSFTDPTDLTRVCILATATGSGALKAAIPDKGKAGPCKEGTAAPEASRNCRERCLPRVRIGLDAVVPNPHAFGNPLCIALQFSLQTMKASA